MTRLTTIHQLLQAHSSTNDENPAIINIENKDLTYSQLFSQVNRTIKQLRLFNIKQTDKVAIALPNGTEMALAFISVTCGAICCPLNPNYRENEFEFYLSDLDAKALITQSGFSPEAVKVAQKLDIPVINLISSSEDLSIFTLKSSISTPDNQDSKNRNINIEYIEPQPEDIALILHTSGTTSTPKQVPLTHSNLCSSAYNISQTLELTTADRSLNVMPLFHIHGLMGVLLSSLTAGASVVCTNGFNCEDFLDWIEQLQPTWYSAVPTIHQAVLAEVKTNPQIIDNIILRFIRSSSASLPPQVMAELESVFNIPVIEAYGMTEASHQMACNPLPPLKRKPGSVGIPTGIELAVMNQDGTILPSDIIGEVVIKGKSITHGYLNNPDANQAGFINNWFRTGDNGYLDSDGYLFLEGRIKEIINRGGEKIMPLEVDNVVMELPQVYQSVTFAVPHATLGEDVATAVVFHPEEKLDPQEIRTFLFNKLTDFKIPSQIIIVDKIPKGATGKLQRIGLYDKLKDALTTVDIPPGNETESKIANIFQEVLTLKSVSVEDNFFALGGDSIKGSQVINRINNEFNLDFISIILFQKPTIAELAFEIIKIQEQSENDELQQLAAQLENLSPEELSQLIREVKQDS